jgi:hypothetical protein
VHLPACTPSLDFQQFVYLCAPAGDDDCGAPSPSGYHDLARRCLLSLMMEMQDVAPAALGKTEQNQTASHDCFFANLRQHTISP